MMEQPRLIVLDDEPDLSEMVVDIARSAGFNAKGYTDPAQLKSQYDHAIDVIILDLMMPDIDGIEIIRFLAEVKCTAHIILMSGFDSGVLHSAKKLASEHKLNVCASLSKPFRISELKKCLSNLDISTTTTTQHNITEAPSIDELRQAIAQNEFTMFYQPKVCLSNRLKPSAEALVRWKHPQRGLLPPSLFIKMAEENNLIDQITWLIIEQVVSHCNQWRKQGLDIQIAINMSARTLKDLSLPERIETLVRAHDIAPSQLTLEITETALMQKLSKSLDILTRLRLKGFNLSIDDFGTGYSSLVQLYRAPFSEIKVDQSFVLEMETELEAATIVETIIMLGKKLNMKTIAEGVETESCQRRLTELGCDFAQGYYFARPMPGDELPGWFVSRMKNQD